MSFHSRHLLQTAAVAALLAITVATPSLAQERTFTFDIPAESLSKALRDYAQTTHDQLVFTEDLTGRKSTRALKGTYSGADALARLLGRNGLSAERAPSGALVIRSARSVGENPSSVTGGGGADAAPSVSEVIVTANKKAERLSNIGEGISVVGGAQLERLNANTLEDYLSFVPGVAFTSFGRPGQNQVTIRGIAALGLGSAIATYVDEIPVGSSSNEAQGGVYTPDIDPADLDHVEVLKGPQGTLYGASSLGGLLKYVTKAPSLTKSELTAGVEVNDIDHGDLGYKLRLGGTTPLIEDRLGLRASGYYRSDAGFIDNPLLGTKNVNSDDSYGGRVALLYTPIDRLKINLSAIYQHTKADGLNAVSYNTPANAPPPFFVSHGDLNQYLRRAQPNSVEDQIYSLDIHYDLGWAELVSATGFSREDTFRNTDVTGTYTRPS